MNRIVLLISFSLLAQTSYCVDFSSSLVRETGLVSISIIAAGTGLCLLCKESPTLSRKIYDTLTGVTLIAFGLSLTALSHELIAEVDQLLAK